jgi:general secretion pathway protein G
MGFTLIELLTVLVVLGGLASLAVPRTEYTIDQAETARATGDIRAIFNDILSYVAAGGALPASLNDVDRGALMDPWGRPYGYVDLSSGGTPRTDVFGVPLNADFDVYSRGPDGARATSVTAGVSQDDVVRGNDGGFIGRASRY